MKDCQAKGVKTAMNAKSTPRQQSHNIYESEVSPETVALQAQILLKTLHILLERRLHIPESVHKDSLFLDKIRNCKRQSHFNQVQLMKVSN